MKTKTEFLIKVFKQFRFVIILELILLFMVIVYSFASDQLEFIVIFIPVTIMCILMVIIVNGSRKEMKKHIQELEDKS